MAKKIIKILNQGAKDKRTKTTTQKSVNVLDEFKPSVVAKKMGISTQKFVAVKKQVKEGKLFSPELRDFFVKIGNKLLGVKTKEELEFEKFLKEEGVTKREFKKQQKELEKLYEEGDKGIIGGGGKIAPAGGVVGGEVVEVSPVIYGGVNYDTGEILNGEKWGELKGGLTYYQNDADTRKDLWSKGKIYREIKELPDLTQIESWWETIGKGTLEYFVVTRKFDKELNSFLYVLVDIRTLAERRARAKINREKKQAEEDRAQEIKNS